MAIVLPDGIFGNPSDRYVWHFILENAKISAIISLPPETFLPSTHTKGNYILDNRRNKIIDDDLPLIVSKYQEFIEKSYIHRQSHLGFTIKLSEMQDIKENDILLVTEGTFLIGRTAIVTSFDKKLVIQSHLRRIRCLKPDNLHPYLLLYLLNTEIMQKQIEEKTFVQATISTVGDRFYEIVLPVPTDKEIISWITNDISEIIKMKVEARRKMEDLIRSGKKV